MPELTPPLETVLRLLFGALLGGIIGFERHSHGRPAGLRTHLLVCLASVLVMTVSSTPWPGMPEALTSLDPARLAAGAITGIGFLGAGVIIKSGVNIQGLTTAASIWIVSVIGLAVGRGLYLAALTAFVLTFLALWILRRVEGTMGRISYRSLVVTARGDLDGERISAVVAKNGLAVEGVEYDRDLEKGESTYRLSVSFRGEDPMRRVADELTSLPDVRRVAFHA